MRLRTPGAHHARLSRAVLLYYSNDPPTRNGKGRQTFLRDWFCPIPGFESVSNAKKFFHADNRTGNPIAYACRTGNPAEEKTVFDPLLRLGVNPKKIPGFIGNFE